jgi:ATP-dependent Clp protease ATP-binding subunit ClpC
VAGQVPPALASFRIVVLDLPMLVAASGELSKCIDRIMAIIAELSQQQDILFLNDLYSPGRTQNAAFGLMLAIARGKAQCIAACTPAEYDEFVAQDPILQRCFQPVPIAPASKELTLEILRSLRERYEAHHRVKISDAALAAAVELADSPLPEAAIDLIDEAGAMLRVETLPPLLDLGELVRQIKDLTEKKEAAVGEQDFEQAAHLLNQADKLKKRQEALAEELKQKMDSVCGEVDDKLIARVVGERKASRESV